MPGFFKPMLATLVNEPFDNEEWLFEIKWDGYRGLSFINQDKIQIYSRNKNSFNEWFGPVIQDLAKLKTEAILDGEFVILDKKGKPSFQLMQNYRQNNEGNLRYFVFDILFYKGEDLREKPLIERKQILKKLLQSKKLNLVVYGDHIIGKGISFFKEIDKEGLEGIVAKKIDSPYVTFRSRDWLKIKTHQRQEVVIGGFTAPRNSRSYFGALVLGVYDEEGKLKHIGQVGGGFNEKLLKDTYMKMRPLIQAKSPFDSKVRSSQPITWIKPQLVCEISFHEWTTDGRVRMPIFKGLRVDKKVKEVKRETTNVDKIYWPKEKYTKGDLLEYYKNVAPYILPYLKDRPVMLKRYPEGIEGNIFYQKDSTPLKPPSYVKTVPIEHEEKTLRYILIQDEPTLEYVVNLGSIELHPFISKVARLDKPDFLIIDLDPEAIDFIHVIETAKQFKKILDQIDVPCYCKTSGGRGLHIYIPLGGKYTFDQARGFGLAVAMLVHEQLPEITSLERRPIKRQKKVYLDVMQNHEKQTVVVPYSVRGKPAAPVSTPLKWTEVKKGLDPKKFNIKTLPARLKKVGDLYKPVLGKGVNLLKAIKSLEKLNKDR